MLENDPTWQRPADGTIWEEKKDPSTLAGKGGGGGGGYKPVTFDQKLLTSAKAETFCKRKGSIDWLA